MCLLPWSAVINAHALHVKKVTVQRPIKHVWLLYVVDASSPSRGISCLTDCGFNAVYQAFLPFGYTAVPGQTCWCGKSAKFSVWSLTRHVWPTTISPPIKIWQTFLQGWYRVSWCIDFQNLICICQDFAEIWRLKVADLLLFDMFLRKIACSSPYLKQKEQHLLIQTNL